MIRSSKVLHVVLLCVPSSSLLAMFPHHRHLEFGPARTQYYSANPQVFRPETNNDVSAELPKPCTTFCDPEHIKQNYVVSEDPIKGTRIQTNKFQYGDFDQTDHLLCITTKHREHPDEFSRQEINNQADAIRTYAKLLHFTAYNQQHFTNWGRPAGQSIPHWHSQLESFKMLPLSMPERMRYVEQEAKIKDASAAFEGLKIRLEQAKNLAKEQTSHPMPNRQECPCCQVYQAYDEKSDRKNYVAARFEWNFLCLSHHSSIAAEVSVIPNEHVSSLRYISKKAWQENMAISMALLPIMKEYAHNKVRDCGGANTYTFGLGALAEKQEQCTYHIHTRIMPRTTIVPTPGDLVGNSCKVDYNPDDLYTYLVDNHVEALRNKILEKKEDL